MRGSTKYDRYPKYTNVSRLVVKDRRREHVKHVDNDDQGSQCPLRTFSFLTLHLASRITDGMAWHGNANETYSCYKT